VEQSGSGCRAREETVMCQPALQQGYSHKIKEQQSNCTVDICALTTGLKMFLMYEKSSSVSACMRKQAILSYRG